MSNEYTPEQIGKMCVDYIEINGFSKFFADFGPSIVEGFPLKLRYLGEIPEPFAISLRESYTAWVDSVISNEKERSLQLLKSGSQNL